MDQHDQAGGSAPKVSFKDTLNLPKTDFPIRANSKIEDAAILDRWKLEDLFHQSFVANQGKEKFILHDGPPYANGPLHLGHAYNKILKDIITKSQRMGGKHVPVTPGWDCHGLPIELAVSRAHPGLTPAALKKECRAFAQKWIDIQRDQFKQLGVLMDWDNPYATMHYSYEASILRAFGNFVAQGYIEKKKKTVPWCFVDQTVLATAEIEYHDRKDPSIYVVFPLQGEMIRRYLKKLDGKPIGLLVWTTTPWTLPLNRAVLLRPKTTYQVLEANGQYLIVGKELADSVAALLSIEKKVVDEIEAEELAGAKVGHPFIDNLVVPIILDHSVSVAEGTACVHCAPGCGPQDYDVGIKHNLEIFSPISPDGKYTKGIEPIELEGMAITDAQGWVIRTLEQKGKLVHKGSIKHSYPHCWRCHNGLIFRATNQWFCSLSQLGLREKTMEEIDKTTFLPPKTINYLKATIEGRLEWCLSRQRVWGVPIPALLCKKCGHAYIAPALIEAVAQGVEKEGVEFWDRVTIKELNLEGLTCPDCYSSDFDKEKDILDVWFDSGVSHYAVLLQRPELRFPADLYCEGLDQHRGWFQSSLLTSIVLEGRACTKGFLTHGFTVDQKGHKMSKSLGNVVSPQELIDKIGTDGLRLWVSSINYDGDAVVSPALLENVEKVYRKVRNTCRFLLSNLYDFEFDKDAVSLEDMLLIDQYALEELFQVNYKIRSSYANADFTAVFHTLADYASVELSAFYLDIIKDRLYTEAPSRRARRSAQTVCWYILDTLTRLVAPVLSFTAELISDHYQKNKQTSIHLQPFADLHEVWKMQSKKATAVAMQPAIPEVYGQALEASRRLDEFTFIAERNDQWKLLRDIRSAVLKAIEIKREQDLIKHPLEARLDVHFGFDQTTIKILNDFMQDIERSGQKVNDFFKEFFIVSQFALVPTAQGLEESILKGLWVKVDRALGDKCPRCWQYDTTNNEYKLCNRCQRVLSKS